MSGKRPGFTVWNERRIPPREKVERDLGMLRALGQTKSWEFAEHMGCSEQTAKNRLRALYEAGLADRHRKRHEIGWTYEAKER
jgi:predicted transcriptional regulator